MSHEADIAIELAARNSYGKLVALLGRATGDLELAEDAVAEALADAISAWRERGVPEQPDAWLLTAARNRWTDRHRREARKQSLDDPGQIMQPYAEQQELPDERLSLLFACAHPAIDPMVRTPLLLRCVLGLSVEQIASAMLTSPSAMKQRITRGKAKIRDAGIRLSVPARDELPARLQVTLEAIYAAFNAAVDDGGHHAEATPGSIALESIHLARTIVQLLPDQPEAMGLLSLCLYLHARFDTRTDADGRFVPLDEQETGRWNVELISEAEALLRQAASYSQPGRFQLEASIQSAHVARLQSGEADWTTIVRFYDLLLQVSPSVGAAVGRAAALLQSAGAVECLEQLDRIRSEYGQRITSFQPYWAVRGDALRQSGQMEAAADALQHAMGLTTAAAVRDYLANKLAELNLS